VNKPPYERTEVNGWIVYKWDGQEYKINPVEDYRKTLIKMLEKVAGDKNHPEISEFWAKQSEKLFVTPNQPHGYYQQEIFNRLTEAWDQIFKVPEPDFFAEYDL
jgi:hypothetical protein